MEREEDWEVVKEGEGEYKIMCVREGDNGSGSENEMIANL